MSHDFHKIYDVIIVGGGGSGLRAALELKKNNKKVILVSKVFPTRSHTVSAQGGINAAISNVEKDDNWKWHMFDTIKGSGYLSDQNAVEYMCKNAPNTVYELENFGLPFSRNNKGQIYQRAFGGQTKNFGESIIHRTCAASDKTGHSMLHTLYQKNIEYGTEFLSEWYAIDLVQSQNTICGVSIINIADGNIKYLKSKSVILATGGTGQVYYSTTNAYTNTGDGLGMVLRAGYPLQDMEFIQFHPTGIYGAGVLISEGCRGEGGYLINSKNERYMERYEPLLKDLSCRDVVSRCSMQEILQGRGCGNNKDHVLLKLDHLDEKTIKEKLPGITELAKSFAGVDVLKQPIPVVPTCHYLMGGIPTNILGQVLTIDQNGEDKIVSGLYAVGECACVSVHGANRLGANSLLDIVVFGKSAGEHLSKSIDQIDYIKPSINEIEKSQLRYNRIQYTTANNKKENLYSIRAILQKTMEKYFGVFKNHKDMTHGINILNDIKSNFINIRISDQGKYFNLEKIELLELENLFEVALSIAHLALNRKESRGAHSRNDYTKTCNKNWLKHSIFFSDGSIKYRNINMNTIDTKPFFPKVNK